MDNPARRPVVAFGPSRPLAGACLGGAVVGIGLAGFDVDPAGRLLVGVAAVVLLVLGLYDILVTPRLTASAAGVAVRSGLRLLEVSWAQIEDVRLDERARFGLSSRTLEIDSATALIVLGRHSLGREPREVYDLVRAFRPGVSR